MDCSFVRPTAKKTQDPFIVVTHIEFDIEAGVMEFGEEIKDIEGVLMSLPGKTEKEIWTMIVYRNKQSFEEKGDGARYTCRLSGERLVVAGIMACSGKWARDVIS